MEPMAAEHSAEQEPREQAKTRRGGDTNTFSDPKKIAYPVSLVCFVEVCIDLGPASNYVRKMTG